MTFDELKTKMESLGFKYQPHGRNTHDSIVGLFFRRVEFTRQCLTNEKGQFVVELYDRARYENLHIQDFPDRYSFEADVTGEFVKDLWAKLRVYGMRPEVFFERHKEIETALVRAWEALG